MPATPLPSLAGVHALVAVTLRRLLALSLVALEDLVLKFSRGGVDQPFTSCRRSFS